MVVDLEPGMLLGRYRLIDLLARGGMGTVWIARDEQLERDVALKVLPALLVSEDAARRRFEREARALGRLLHPNVVTIFDVGAADPGTGRELPFLVMELLHGRSLTEEIREGPVSASRAVGVMEQVARALGAAHGAGIVHRDLKPSNVMVGENDHVSVLDFGLARLVHPDSGLPEDPLTTPGMVLGSCSYMSPEQALGRKVGPASDIFACGAVLYEALSGRKAFDGANPVRVLQEVVRGRHEPLGPEVPAPIAAVVERCLNREAEARYENGATLARELASVREDTASGVHRLPFDLVGARRRPQGRRAWLLAGTAAAVLTLAAGLVAGLLIGRTDREPIRPDPGAWRVRPIHRTEGELGRPDWSPSGGRLAVEHKVDDRSEILVVEEDGERVQVRASAVGREVLTRPRFSPDGTLLLICSKTGDGTRLRVLPALGGAPLAEIADADRGAWLSKEQILFRRTRDREAELWSFDLTSSSSSRLMSATPDRSWWDAEPRADGALVAVGGAEEAGGRLWFVSAEGGEPISWPVPAGPFEGMSWSRSGRSLAAVVAGTLMQLTAEGSRSVVPPLADLAWPGVSPDGKSIAAVRNQLGFGLVGVDPSTGEAVRVAGPVGTVGPLAVGPDGAIVYGRAPGEWGGLRLREPGGEEYSLLGSGEAGACPVFSPVGQEIAFLCRSAHGELDLRAWRRGGRRARVLTKAANGRQPPSWSPDGRYITYAAGSIASVWVVEAAGGPPRLLTASGGDSPAWSPDGRWIAYVVRGGEARSEDVGVWIVPPRGGRAQHVGDVSAPLGWSRDGRLWQLRRSREDIELWEAAADDWRWQRRSTLQLAAGAGGGSPRFAVDAATDRLLISRARTSAELIVLDGIDPSRW